MKELIIFIEDQDRLLELSKSPNHEIRAKVAYNKNVSESILETLANDKSELVRGIVSQQLKTPLNVLETLLNDTNPFIRREAGLTLLKKDKNIESIKNGITIEDGFEAALNDIN